MCTSLCLCLCFPSFCVSNSVPHSPLFYSILLLCSHSEGTLKGRLAMVASCAVNGTTCSVAIVPMSESEKKENTTRSSMNLELVDMATLSVEEVARITIDTERHKKIQRRSLDSSTSRALSPVHKKFSRGCEVRETESKCALTKRGRQDDGSESDGSESDGSDNDDSDDSESEEATAW